MEGTITAPSATLYVGNDPNSIIIDTPSTLPMVIWTNLNPDTTLDVIEFPGPLTVHSGQGYGTANAAPTITSSQNPSYYGTTVTFTAAISGGATGTVAFADGCNDIGSAPLYAGVATFTTNSLTVGTHKITLVYFGDLNFLPSNSVYLTQTVLPSNPSVVLTSTPNPSQFGTTMTITASVNSNATGTMTFLDGSTILGTSQITSGIATLSTNGLSVGTHAITAVYSGDSNYNAFTSQPLTEVVTPTATSLTLSSTLNPIVYGQSFDIQATVSSTVVGTLAPTGTISYFLGTTPLANLANLPVGIDTITVVYSGDNNYASSSAAITETVYQDTSSININESPNPNAYGTALPYPRLSPLGYPVRGFPRAMLHFTMAHPRSPTYP